MRVLMGQRGKIGILTISNGKESQDVFIYAEALDRYKKLLKTDEVLVFTGRCRARRDENGVTGKLSFTASEVQTMEEMRARKGAVLNITLSATKDLKDVAKVLSTDKTGSEEGVACRIDVLTQGYSGEIRPEFYVRPTDDLVQMLKAQDGVIGAGYQY